MANCKECLPCPPKLKCKKLPCGLNQQVSNTYPYFSGYLTPPPASTFASGGLGSGAVSEEIGDDPEEVVFEGIVIAPPLPGGGNLNPVGVLFSPLTGGGPYLVGVTDGGDDTVTVTIPYNIYLLLYNQGVFIQLGDEATVKDPYYLNLQVFWTE